MTTRAGNAIRWAALAQRHKEHIMEVSQNVLNFQFACLGFSIGSIVTVFTVLYFDKLEAAQHRMHLTALRRWQILVALEFIALLFVVLVIIGGK